MFKAIATKIILFVSIIFGIPTMQTKTSSTTPQNPIIIQATTTPEKTPEINTAKEKTEVKTPEKVLVETKTKPIITAKTKTEPTKPIEVQQNKISFEAINVNTRKAIVNILCNTKAGGTLSPITGSGILISGNGVILTNAHIAQYFLLKDFNNQKNFISCIARTGSPAYPAYNLELIYISPKWVEDNKSILIEESPKGTGEHDYAFLRITGKVDDSELGVTPYLPISLDEKNNTGAYTLLASYPAGFLGTQSILRDLYQTSSIVPISSVYTFSTSTIDLISVGGTVVSQKGSSGGAVVNDSGELIGVISTESEATKTSDRDLRAITTAYINRDLTDESGSNILDILSFPEQYAENFNKNIAPKLTEILTNAILKK